MRIQDPHEKALAGSRQVNVADAEVAHDRAAAARTEREEAEAAALQADERLSSAQERLKKATVASQA
ncbi:MAG: hypothetical protein LC799_00545, partial [Actinobacteria bacterium]|nr:hypothetical protein [Actinomycetota bacterium]